MKKLLALTVTAAMALSFAACGKNVVTTEGTTIMNKNNELVTKVNEKGETEAYVLANDPADAFKGVTMWETNSTNTISFSATDNTFTEIYEGSEHNGTWVFDDENDVMELTYDGADFTYYFPVIRDEAGMITGIGQGDYEAARNFQFK